MKLEMFWKLAIIPTIILFGSFSIYSQTNVVMAIDSSQSMETNDPAGYRFSSAAEFMDYFSFLGNTRAGIVAFGTRAEQIRAFDALSSDSIGKYENNLREIEKQKDKTGSTEIGKGLNLSLEIMLQAGGRKNIILVSDGILDGDTKSRGVGSEQAADELATNELWNVIVPKLKEKEIKVFTAGLFGKSKSGEALLKRLAEETGGFYSPVTSAKEFSAIFDRIRDKIDPPSTSLEVASEVGSFEIPPETARIIIEGNQEFTITAPDGTIYPAEDRNSAPLKSYYVLNRTEGSYRLYLEPRDSTSLAGRWTSKSAGRITVLPFPYAQLVKLEDNKREFYFLNEVILLKYAPKIIDNKLVSKEELGNCKIDYEINRTERDGILENFARGSLAYFKDKDAFLGESENELRTPGSYQIKTDLVCPGKGRISKTPDTFQAVEANFTKIEIFDEKEKLLDKLEIPVDSKILIKGGFDDAALKQVNNTAFTFTGSKSRTMYISITGKEEFKKSYKEVNGTLQSDLIGLKEGSNTVKIDIDGDIFVQRKEDTQADRFPIKIRTTKIFKVVSPGLTPDWFEAVKRWIKDVGGLIAAILGAIFLIYKAIRKFFPSQKKIANFSKAGFRYNKGKLSDVAPLEHPHGKFFSGDITASVGFAGSGADVEIEQEDGEGVFMDVGMKSNGEFYVVPKQGVEISIDNSEPIDGENPVSNGSILDIIDTVAEYATKLQMFIENDSEAEGGEEERY